MYVCMYVCVSVRVKAFLGGIAGTKIIYDIPFDCHLGYIASYNLDWSNFNNCIPISHL